jgi:2-oxo-hept-3-ene-1,7-dioate hydratase
MLTESQRQAAAEHLMQAQANRQVIPQLSKTHPQMTIDDAYDIQRRWAAARVAAGARVIGRKIGLTSRAMQMASKMTEPDYGVMLDDACFHDGARIAAGTFIKPRLETELAFVMGADLAGAAGNANSACGAPCRMVSPPRWWPARALIGCCWIPNIRRAIR